MKRGKMDTIHQFLIFAVDQPTFTVKLCIYIGCAKKNAVYICCLTLVMDHCEQVSYAAIAFP